MNRDVICSHIPRMHHDDIRDVSDTGLCVSATLNYVSFMSSCHEMHNTNILRSRPLFVSLSLGACVLCPKLLIC